MGYRLGWTLYWVCLGLIAMYVLFWLAVLQGSTWEAIRSDLSEWKVLLAVSSPVLVLYGLGREPFATSFPARSMETCVREAP